MRQCAALLLRKRYSKTKHWTSLPEEVKENLKTILMQVKYKKIFYLLHTELNSKNVFFFFLIIVPDAWNWKIG